MRVAFLYLGYLIGRFESVDAGYCKIVYLQQPTLSDMTQSELTFAYRIDGMMSIIAHPEYRQLMVEVGN